MKQALVFIFGIFYSVVSALLLILSVKWLVDIFRHYSIAAAMRGAMMEFQLVLYLIASVILIMFLISSIGIMFYKEWARKIFLRLVCLVSVSFAVIIFIGIGVGRGCDAAHSHKPGVGLSDFSIITIPLIICIASAIFFTRPTLKYLFKVR